MKDPRFIERFIHLAKELPSAENTLGANAKRALRPAEERGWVWYNSERKEWKLTREGEKIAGELAADFPEALKQSGNQVRAEVWETINRYVQACGGDPSNKTVSAERMNAVVAVEKAINDEIGRSTAFLDEALNSGDGTYKP